MTRTNITNTNNTKTNKNIKGVTNMTRTGKNERTNKARRTLAAIMTSIMVISAGSAISMTAASATTAPAPAKSSVLNLTEAERKAYIEFINRVKSNDISGSDLLKGVELIVKLSKKLDPSGGIISEGLLGAFKLFYGDSISHQPSTKDIVKFLNDLSDKLDKHYNEQAMQVKALASIERLQNLSKILTSVKGYNEKALIQLALYKGKKMCAQDYINIIKRTSGNTDFIKDFSDLSNLIIDGDSGIKGLPTFKQYLELSKQERSNNNDAALVRKDCRNFNRMVMEQYQLYFSNLITGLNAEYNRAEIDYKNGEISKEARDSIQETARNDINFYFKKAGEVCQKYAEAEKALNELTVAKVTVNGKTTEMFSLGDAWVVAATNGGTLQLVSDWKSDDLSNDTYFYKESKFFKDGVLYAASGNITIDLNGHSIVHSKNRKYDIIANGANLNVTDSAKKQGSVSGILVNNGYVNVNNIVVKDASDSGVRIVDGKATVDNCIFRNNSGSAIWNQVRGITVTNSVFEGNSAENGGAIFSKDDMTVDRCTFINNIVRSNGGAICFDYKGSDFCCVLKVSNCKFSGNTAYGKGGAIYCDSMNYLRLNNVEIKNNKAGVAGGGLYASKGAGSSCDPEISGLIIITNNNLTNGTSSNAFLGENTTSKCVFKIFDDIDPNSRIGVTSPTTDKTLDIVKIYAKNGYNHTENIFSYDTGAYRIHRYNPWTSSLFWIEIVRN